MPDDLSRPTAADAETIAPELYREAMAHLAAAVNIVTTDGPSGRAGFAATAVCSVTDTPATLIVCVKRSSSVGPYFQANGALCVNTLATGHAALSALFGGRTTMDERFAAAEWTVGVTGAPVLVGALAAFDCRITRSVDVGTHAVLFCEVLGVATGGAETGLVYFRRGYGGVSPV